MDNEVSEDLNCFERSDIQFQLVHPDMHQKNAADPAVITFKINFISALWTGAGDMHIYASTKDPGVIYVPDKSLLTIHC